MASLQQMDLIPSHIGYSSDIGDIGYIGYIGDIGYIGEIDPVR